MSEPWSRRKLPLEETWRAEFGPLQLLMRCRAGEILLAENRLNGQESDEGELAWRRWPLQKEWRTLGLAPSFPDLSVVVRAEEAMVLSPDSKTLVYVRCPLWASLLINENNPALLTEVPVVVLSKTWFGSRTEGTLCYWISSGVQRVIEPDPSRPYLAICPVHISNMSSEELVVERICLRVESLSLYGKDGVFWSNEFRVAYNGSQSTSDITLGKRAPSQAGRLKLIAQPRKPFKETIAARTFRTLKDAAGLGSWSD